MPTPHAIPGPTAPLPQPADGWRAPVTTLPRVGSDRAAQLERLGIRTVGDLLLHGPTRYEDRRQVTAIRSLEKGQTSVVIGRVLVAGVKTYRGGTRSLFEMILDDGTGRLHCRWWNMPFLERIYRRDQEWMVCGRVTSLRPRTMDHPESEQLDGEGETFIHVRRLVPVYPLTEGLTQRALRSMTWHALERCAAQIPEPVPDLIPRQPQSATASPWPSRASAFREIHFPDSPESAERARQRLALDELIDLQLGIQERRLRLEAKARAIPCAGDNRWMRPFLKSLPFDLTPAQTRVLRELRAELGGPVPMRRLLQGDVGSGKTIVAACCALMALESGWNVALMAPTEILAQQLHGHFHRWFSPLGLTVLLRTGRQPNPSGPAQESPGARVFVGTHALIQQQVELDRLGLVIIDEQHKFGVEQRESLLRKGRYPHLLVMTATPIPRTLGLTLYGDLDVSTLDGMPAGRGVVKTHLRSQKDLPAIWNFVRSQLDKGQQAFVVCPRVSEGDGDQVRAVVQEGVQLREVLAPHRVEVLHGQMSSEEQDRIMSAFRAGSIHVLVATSLVEVGVDVPNATLMIIESAERFGLAQLHQLRGRVGRGGADGHCILVQGNASPEGRDRLRILTETRDGFELAEADLRLRGPGEFLGTAQSGGPNLVFASLSRDRQLVELARSLVRRHLWPERQEPL